MYLTYKNYIDKNKDVEAIISSKIIFDNDDRVKYASKHLKGKKILNIGCLNHSIDAYNQQHEEIVKLGSKVVGIDIIEEAKKIGKDIEIGDITTTDFIQYLKNKYGSFDVIFAGELIEHLDNYKVFFERLHELLDSNGVFIISTPNPYGLHYFKEVAFKKILKNGNTDHKAWIDIYQLIFNVRTHYKLIDYVHLNPKRSIEQIILKITRTPQLSMNYLAIFKKITSN